MHNLKYIILIIVLFFGGCSSTSIKKGEKISMYFYMSDAISSSTATKKNIVNTPDAQSLANIRYCALRLDEVRRILDRDLVITSWYRDKKLNKTINGSSSSAHMRGLAVDFMLNNTGELEILKEKLSSYDQMIYYRKTGHLHIGFEVIRAKERRQFFIR